MKQINSQTAKMLYPSVDFSLDAADKIIKAHGGEDSVNSFLVYWGIAKNNGINQLLHRFQNLSRPCEKWLNDLLSCYDGSLQSSRNIILAIEFFGMTIGGQAGIPFKMESRLMNIK